MIVSMPPQHGKSLGSSQLLPAFMLGLNPDLRICIGSYSFMLARRFGLGVQRLIESDNYRSIFPKTFLKGMKADQKGEGSLRTADEFDVVGAAGGLRLVGREGSLTGNRVDVMILDDLYKDAAEANSPLIRQGTWDWFVSVARTRLHNNSQELIVFTRWHDDDLVGRIAQKEVIVDVTDTAQIQNLVPSDWVRINFPALKVEQPTTLDPREPGQALWPERHSAELLLSRQAADGVVFEALYQGNPISAEGLLYTNFKTYDQLPANTLRLGNYTDTADQGLDKLCSICYAVDGSQELIYVLDVVYSAMGMDITEGMVAKMILDCGVRQATIESNNGGRGFARQIERLTRGACAVKSFHQSANKESRILTNATAVCSSILMPNDWRRRWPEFASDLLNFKRLFRANSHDDAADALTGVVECEFCNSKMTKRIRHIGFTEKIKN